MSDYKYISQKLVTRYAVRKALANRLKDWLKKRRLEILDLFARGYRCPRSGPYILELEPQGGSPAYKQIFLAYLTEELLPQYGEDLAVAQAMAEKELQKIVAAFGTKEVVHLEAKQNPLYKEGANIKRAVA